MMINMIMIMIARVGYAPLRNVQMDAYEESVIN
jgi:hypothetical protein